MINQGKYQKSIKTTLRSNLLMVEASDVSSPVFPPLIRLKSWANLHFYARGREESRLNLPMET